MMQDACKTPWTKATDTQTSSLSLSLSLSLTHSLARSCLQIRNLSQSYQSATDITTDLLEDALSGRHGSANWKPDHVSGCGQNVWTRTESRRNPTEI